MKQSKYDLRLARADYLAAQYPFAVEALNFFHVVCRAQAEIYSRLGAHREIGSLSISDLQQGELPERHLSGFPVFLSRIQEVSPQPLASTAQRLKEQGAQEWRGLFADCWQGRADSERHPSEIAFGRMYLQPFAEQIADQQELAPTQSSPTTCPFCFEKPLVGVFRPEGDGGKRHLMCSMCATEWPYGRILCASCGEQKVEQLAVYSTEQFAHVRIDACDTCRSYLKTVDLTKTGRAVPIVDEVATIPLNLWAIDHGYTKLQTNLLGL